MMGCCSRNRSRRTLQVCSVLLLLLLSPCSAELNAAVVRPGPAARRLLVSRPSTSRQKAEQQMKVGGRNTPFKQPAASFGRRRIPRSGWNPIQNR